MQLKLNLHTVVNLRAVPSGINMYLYITFPFDGASYSYSFNNVTVESTINYNNKSDIVSLVIICISYNLL